MNPFFKKHTNPHPLPITNVVKLRTLHHPLRSRHRGLREKIFSFAAEMPRKYRRDARSGKRKTLSLQKQNIMVFNAKRFAVFSFQRLLLSSVANARRAWAFMTFSLSGKVIKKISSVSSVPRAKRVVNSKGFQLN